MAASPPPDDALSDDGLEHLFTSLNHAAGIIAAVSGGPDSIALMHLLARWRVAGSRPPILVVTVDHGLRPEAADEAAFVAREADALGLRHRILAWAGDKPRTGIQEAAREARYRLLADLAHAAGASHLVTAHTLDDQAETIMMRLARGSGLAGLAGMRRETERRGIVHARPLLGWPKARLLDLCRSQGWRFVEDPSNANTLYARVRWRRLMPLLAAEGLDAERLSRFAERAARADEALDLKAREALEGAGLVEEGGRLSFRGGILASEPLEIALRALEQALRRAGFGLDNSRLNRLETCAERLRRAVGAGEALNLTIAGALVQLDRAGKVSIGPEPPRRRGR
ncbi:tRNA lysidine(34) synthetase TilS [Microvirga lotononidis]|uniref:tRNA(Ile)-lysidine synthase n=1 Tax=Microvirga lotononidis TaxID=864069 RepID=I4YTV4_9HYPH|nr:tRNA lysidine(34) synthetase TilS [Microvirga lotononidis]EIM27396.1 tRNA(Ile)-lysidine synthetase [Microvirga lotononidis]WQO28438.1 tRNA lysidine(34) synthetase TilS [Microvirga lotononidis]